MPTSKTAYAPGDVVVVPFPYSDRLAEKRRPALVVSNEHVRAEGFVWVVMITSAVHNPLSHDVPIADLPLAGLGAPSLVRPTKIACIEPPRILRRAGRLSSEQSGQVAETIRSFVGGDLMSSERRS
jgi:mRNA interferase MazF